jgi:hypothetical protein
MHHAFILLLIVFISTVYLLINAYKNKDAEASLVSVIIMLVTFLLTFIIKFNN